jgi:transglutaminase/protease-like cytokinesis protein 3
MRMSKEEILFYRSTGIPDDLQVYMANIAGLTQSLDSQTDETRRAELKQEIIKLLTDAKDRADHYYMKRIKDFGIHNMRLRKLSESFSELIFQFRT